MTQPDLIFSASFKRPGTPGLFSDDNLTGTSGKWNAGVALALPVFQRRLRPGGAPAETRPASETMPGCCCAQLGYFLTASTQTGSGTI
jgi:hypothetical protein